MAENGPDIHATQAASVAAGGVADALDAATKSARDISSEAASAAPVNLQDFAGAARGESPDGLHLGLLDDVALRVKVELGRTQMYVEDVLRLNTASVVELDKAAGDPVDIFVNDRHVARGEVLVLNDNFCVRISEIIAQDSNGLAGSRGSRSAVGSGSKGV